MSFRAQFTTHFQHHGGHLAVTVQEAVPAAPGGVRPVKARIVFRPNSNNRSLYPGKWCPVWRATTTALVDSVEFHGINLPQP